MTSEPKGPIEAVWQRLWSTPDRVKWPITVLLVGTLVVAGVWKLVPAKQQEAILLRLLGAGPNPSATEASPSSSSRSVGPIGLHVSLMGRRVQKRFEERRFSKTGDQLTFGCHDHRLAPRVEIDLPPGAVDIQAKATWVAVENVGELHTDSIVSDNQVIGTGSIEGTRGPSYGQGPPTLELDTDPCLSGQGALQLSGTYRLAVDQASELVSFSANDYLLYDSELEIPVPEINSFLPDHWEISVVNKASSGASTESARLSIPKNDSSAERTLQNGHLRVRSTAHLLVFVLE